jgi:hypothetical protein
MKRHPALLLCLLLLGCPPAPPALTSSDPAGRDPEPGPELTGGALALPACGYTLRTPVGASAPLWARDRLGPDPTPFAVHLGLAGDPARTVSVVWRTRDEATLSTQIQYGIGDALDQWARGVTFHYLDPDERPVRIHEVHLCGLRPGTTYSYRVGGTGPDGQAVFSPTYRFHTAPDPAAAQRAQVLLAVLGDTRGGYVRWGEMLALAFRLGPPDLILFPGDAVTLGTFQAEWDLFFAAAGDRLATVPLVFAHGNHEANAAAYYAQLALPGDEQHFGLDYGPAHITVLNDTPPDAADLAGRAAPFLEADLRAAAAAPWRLAMHHWGLWSAAKVHGGDATLRALFGPLFDRYRVDLVVNGHDHNYERTKPLRGSVPQSDPRNGTIYVVSGSAGAPLYESGRESFTEKSESTESLVLLRVRAGALDLSAYRPDGTLLDSLTLTR